MVFQKSYDTAWDLLLKQDTPTFDLYRIELEQTSMFYELGLIEIACRNLLRIMNKLIEIP